MKSKIHNLISILIIGIVTIWYIYSFFYGERVWAGNGAGWDGVEYAKKAMDFHNYLFTNKISSYYLMHSLPSAIVYYVSLLFNIPLKNVGDVVNAFLIYQFILIAISALYVNKVAELLKFRTKTKYILFLSLYATLPLLKKFLYLPVGTDITAFVFGVICYYYYLKRNIGLLFLFSFLGAFVYPSMIYAGTVLVAFCTYSLMNDVKRFKFSKLFKKADYIFIGVYAAGIFLVLKNGYVSKYGSQQLNPYLMHVSIPVILFFLYRTLKGMSIYENVKEIYIIRLLKSFASGLIYFFSVFFIVKILSNGSGGGLSINEFIEAIVYGSIVNPLVSLVCHISYYGPLVLLIIVFWKRISEEIKKEGLGTFIFILMYIILSLGRESRQFINAWPVFVFITCKYLNKIELSWRFVGLFGLVSLIYSKVWFTVNVDGISTSNSLLEFPAQRFFMMNGAWMSTQTYLVHLLVTIILFLIMYYFMKKDAMYEFKLEKPSK